MKLLNTTNYKTVKGEKLGIMTGVLYLAPAKISGYEVCPMRSKGCTDACLYTAGMGIFSNVQTARINKTKRYFEDRESFLNDLRKDIKSLIKKANTANMIPAVRLNGTSDINWLTTGIMNEFPDIQFYDYTKVYNRLEKDIPSNYHLTFSKSETNTDECIKALKLGINVAAVFSTKKGESLPEYWSGYEVIDGDTSDVRFLDKKGGYVVGLRAKGKAKKSDSNFIINVNL